MSGMIKRMSPSGLGHLFSGPDSFWKYLWLDEFFEGWSLYSARMRTEEQALNVREEENQYVIELTAPGYTEDNLEVLVDQRTLTLQGTVEEKKKIEEEKYLVHEAVRRNFSRTLVLADDADTENISAHLANGVLSITVAKRTAPAVQKIKISK